MMTEIIGNTKKWSPKEAHGDQNRGKYEKVVTKRGSW
jgi:hypothetical protein